jgi:uncharacterized protein (DUF58 family)
VSVSAAPAEVDAPDPPPRPGHRPARGTRAWWAAWTPVPTPRAAALVALGALVTLVAPTEVGWLVPLGSVAVLVLVDGALTPAPWRVEVVREVPTVVPLDGTGTVTWRVDNPRGRRLHVALADELAPSLGAAHRRAHLTLPPHGGASASVDLHPVRRGTFRPSVVTVRVTGPLGVATRQSDRVLPGRIEVHPAFRSRRQAELRLRRARPLHEGRRAITARGGGTEFEALRDHVEGDEHRHIDWAATARRGRPIVRTFRAERNQQVLVLLDAGRVVAGTVRRTPEEDPREQVPRLDHGMDATLALTTVAIGLGDRVGLVAFGARVRAVVPPRRDADQLRRISRALHTLEPELAESGYREAFRTTLARFHRRALLVLVTELAAEAVQETLVPALPLVLRDHAVLVVSIRDPQLEAWRDATVTGPGDAYRAAAATSVLAARDRAAARLRALGAVVVDGPPDELPSRLIDGYLDLKFSGRL